MRRRHIGPAPLIKRWFDAHRGENSRRSAMLAWLSAAGIDYEIVVTGEFMRTEGDSTREIFLADIDKARTTILFTAWDDPYALVIVEISDDLYTLRQHEHEFDQDEIDEIDEIDGDGPS